MLQYREKRTQKFYAPGRDILGFYRPLNLEVLEILRERHPDKQAEVNKLEMLMNAIINEATAGARGWDLETIIHMVNETMKDIDDDIRTEYALLFVSAMTFRYILGKREVPEDQVQDEELGKAFGGVYMLGMLPEELAEKVRKHLLAYNHMPKIVLENEPPCEVVEVEEEDGEDDQSS